MRHTLTINGFLISMIFLCFAGNAAAQQKPNIVFIIGDDIGYADFGCYGNKEVKTPNIDRIAAAGIKFTNMFLTASSCSPSRSSIISGRYPHNTGAAELHTPMPGEIITFPGILKQHGYYTAASGKWHQGNPSRKDFDVIYDKGNEIGEGGEDMWLQTLQECPAGKPFFLWLAAIDAHRPWRTNQFEGTNQPSKIIPKPYLANTETTKKDIASYYDEVTRFDHFVGLVEGALKKKGVLDNTIIIITSDNGAPNPHAKARLYDEGMRTPFIFRWHKNFIRPGFSSSLISIIDVAPTLLEIAGIQPGDNFQGKSFRNILKTPGAKFRNYVFGEHNWHDFEALERSVRTKDFLYIINLRPSLSNPGAADVMNSQAFKDLQMIRDSGQLSVAQADPFMQPRPFEELYDCRKDPYQLVNLASSPMHQSHLLHLRKLMQEWKAQTDDTYPLKITPDWFDRANGKSIPNSNKRGEMPGGKNALKTKGKGPF